MIRIRRTVGLQALSLSLVLLALALRPARARIGDGQLLLRWSESPDSGTTAALIGPAGTEETVELRGDPRAHRFSPIPAGTARLELRAPGGTLRHAWRVPLAAELTTVAVVDAAAESLRVLPVHPDPFGNWEVWDETECVVLPGLGPERALSMDTRPGPPADVMLDGNDLTRGAHLRPRPPTLENTTSSVQTPLGTPPAALASTADWILTNRADPTGVSGIAESGTGRRFVGEVQGSWRGPESGHGSLDAFGAFQGMSWDEGGPAGVADGTLPNNELSALETRALVFFRPTKSGLARLDFYAFGEKRHHLLQEFLLDSEHTPEDRADLHGSAAYDHRAGHFDLAIETGFTRALNRSGDGLAFTSIPAYIARPGENEEAVSRDGLYWSGSGSDQILRPHLYNYMTQDLTTTWMLRGETRTELFRDAGLRIGAEWRGTTYRRYEHLDPILAAQGDPNASTNYAAHLGYTEDGQSHLDEGPNGPRKPVSMAVYGSQRLPLGSATLEAGLRWESFTPDQDAVKDPADPVGETAGEEIDPARLSQVSARTGLDPRLGLYLPIGENHFWVDAGRWRQVPPYEALYYSPNLLQNQANLAGNGHLRTTRDYVFGNPALEPEVTRSAQVGFFRQLRRTARLRASVRAAEVSDAWAAVGYHASDDPASTSDLLYYYENRGKRRDRGLHLGLYLDPSSSSRLRVSWDLSKTETNVIEPATLLQAWLLPNGPTEGSSTRESAPLAPLWSHAEPGGYFPSLLDRRHRFSVAWMNHLGPEAGGSLLSPVFAGADFTATLRAASGAPFTPTYLQKAGNLQADDQGVSALDPAQPRDVNGNGLLDAEEINSARMSWSWQLDASFRRQFPMGSGSVGVLLEGRNLTDQQNEQMVYGYTGEADDDGWLDSPSGSGTTNAEAIGQSAADDYRERIDNPLHYGEGRTFRFALFFAF